MDIRGHPKNAQNGDDVAFEDAERFQSQPTQYEGGSLNENIVVTDERVPGGDDAPPGLPGRLMVGIIGIEDGKQGACINENVHDGGRV